MKPLMGHLGRFIQAILQLSLRNPVFPKEGLEFLPFHLFYLHTKLPDGILAACQDLVKCYISEIPLDKPANIIIIAMSFAN